MSEVLARLAKERNAVLWAWAQCGVPLRARWKLAPEGIRSLGLRLLILELHCTACPKPNIAAHGNLWAGPAEVDRGVVPAMLGWERKLAERWISFGCSHLEPLVFGRSVPPDVLAAVNLAALADPNLGGAR